MRELESALREHFRDQLLDVRLFGSFARQRGDERSDVDVFVLIAHKDYRSQRAVLDLAADISVERGLWLSPTVFGKEEYEAQLAERRPLASAIEREGLRA